MDSTPKPTIGHLIEKELHRLSLEQDFQELPVFAEELQHLGSALRDYVCRVLSGQTPLSLKKLEDLVYFKDDELLADRELPATAFGSFENLFNLIRDQLIQQTENPPSDPDLGGTLALGNPEDFLRLAYFAYLNGDTEASERYFEAYRDYKEANEKGEEGTKEIIEETRPEFESVLCTSKLSVAAYCLNLAKEYIPKWALDDRLSPYITTRLSADIVLAIEEKIENSMQRRPDVSLEKLVRMVFLGVLAKNPLIRELVEKRNKEVGKRRSEALRKMGRETPETPAPSLSYCSEACKFLRIPPEWADTYCDTAQFGMKSAEFAKEAEEYHDAPVGIDYEEAVSEFKRSILANLESSSLNEVPRFDPAHVHFISGGANAFGEFIDKYVQEGDAILISSEEYGPIVERLEKKGAKLIRIPPCATEEEYKKAIEKELHPQGLAKLKRYLGGKAIRFILVSEVGRRGTRFPTHLFRDPGMKPEGTFLIVDGCQAAGRHPIDLRQSGADVFIASAHKGSDSGMNTAIIALSSNFVREKDDKIKNGILGLENGGTTDTKAVASSALSLRDDDVKERSGKIQSLSRRFLEILEAATAKNPNLIRVLSPVNLRDPAGNLILQNLTGIFEMAIPGIDRKELSALTLKYGVYIAEDYVNPRDETGSFRIAIHPHMTEDSLLLIVHALISVQKEILKKWETGFVPKPAS